MNPPHSRTRKRGYYANNPIADITDQTTYETAMQNTVAHRLWAVTLRRSGRLERPSGLV